MFRGELALRNGLEGYVAWGYHTAALVRGWTVQRAALDQGGYWTLTAEVTRADPFQLRQAPLEFRTPRRGGFLCWPIVTVAVVGSRLSATLRPPIA